MSSSSLHQSTSQSETNKQFKIACEQGNLETIMNLFNNVDRKTKEEMLSMSTYWNKTPVIKFLLEKGVNPNLNDPERGLVLFKLVQKGNQEMIELYFAMGGNMNIVTENNQNALHYSAYWGVLETAKYLINLGVDFNLKDDDNYTPLLIAKEENKLDLVEFLQQVEKDPTKFVKSTLELTQLMEKLRLK